MPKTLAGRSILLHRLAVLDVEPAGQQRLAAADDVEIGGRHPGGGADVDVHGVAALIDRLVETQQDVLAERVGVDVD